MCRGRMLSEDVSDDGAVGDVDNERLSARAEQCDGEIDFGLVDLGHDGRYEVAGVVLAGHVVRS